jgi:hypothetical protein
MSFIFQILSPPPQLRAPRTRSEIKSSRSSSLPLQCYHGFWKHGYKKEIWAPRIIIHVSCLVLRQAWSKYKYSDTYFFWKKSERWKQLTSMAPFRVISTYGSSTNETLSRGSCGSVDSEAACNSVHTTDHAY